MRIFYSETHRLRDARTELSGGQLVPPFEAPFRLDLIMAACAEQGHGAAETPAAHGFLAHGEEYELPGIGPHVLMTWRPAP